MLAASGGDEFNGFEAQFATAVSDHIGVMANAFFASGGDNNSEKGSGSIIEIGAGYFKPLSKKFVFETYGSIGLGSVSNTYDSGSSKAKFSRLFVQPSIGFASRNFDIAISTRFAGLNYHSINSNGMGSELDEIDYLKNHKFSVLFEPALTIRGGWENFKIQLQAVLSKNLSNPEFPQEESNLNLGLYISIPPK